MQPPLRLEVITGSVRPGRFAPVVARWFNARAREHLEFDTGAIDLIDAGLPENLEPSARTESFRTRLAAADAFVLVTSEYNHGYPAAVKTALDSVKHEWRAKPIGFVSYGGLSGGLRAVEQLRQVAAELHMTSVRESVSFPQAKRLFDADGATDFGPAIDAADRMLRQLAWWAAALRTARAAAGYPG